jgi:hypothetical protein
MNNNNLIILKEYRDKVYVYEVLCTKSCEYYSGIKSIINIPLIISSSLMTILNSGTFQPDELQIPNLVVNALTTLMISLINNFKVVEKASTFRQLGLKYMSLLHHIEDKINNDTDLSADDTREVIKQYDELISQNEYHIPNHIKKKVKALYITKKYLPIILNGDSQATPQQSKQPSHIDQYIL